MTRRKQSKPRALVKVDGPNENGEQSTEKASMNANDINEKTSNNLIKKEPELEIYDATNEEAPIDELFSDGENSFDSFSSELYSSQTSSSFPASDGTVHSYIGGGKSSIRKDKSSRSLDEKSKKNGKSSSSCSYQCQFCDKSFPRLGYLKKHEQSHEEHMPFKCDYCARLFKHKRSRDRHTKLHTGDRRYKCLHCESAFSRSDHLKIHMKTHDNQKPFQCTVCNRGYNTAAALTSHMQNHKKLAIIRDGSGNGSLYNYSPRSTSSLSSSNSVLKRKRYESRLQRSELLQTPQLKCGYCTKSDFQSTDELNTHIKTMHNNDLSATEQHNHFRLHQQEQQAFYENLQISCEFCTMKFETIKKMFHHIKHSHVDRLRKPTKDQIDSSLCDRSKSQRYEIELMDSNWRNDQTPKDCDKNEIKIELDDYDDDDDESMALENEKPTDLSQPKARSMKDEKMRPRSNHMTTTDMKSPSATPSAFMCNQCEASLPDFESFRLHLRSHLDQYNNNNNKSKGHDPMNVSFPAAVSNLICLQCGVTLDNQTDFEYHTEQHFIITNAEYPCETCNKFFPKLEDLQKHLNDIHIQYKCSICQESFDTKIAINLHFSLKHTHEIKIYRCSVCLDVFQLEKEFKHHIRTRHLTHNTIQCVFCRVVCSSEIEMHFHLATHVKQFRCPACSESFHVEFLLDRHLQLHHAHKELITNEPKLQTTVHANKYNENSYNQMIKSSNFYNYQITNKFYNTPLPTDKLRPNSFNVPRAVSTMHSNNSFDSFKSSPNLYLAHAEQATKQSNAESDSDKNNFLYGHHVNSLLAKVRNDENASSSKNALLVPSSVGLNLHLEKRYHQAMIRNIYEKSLQKTNKNKDDVENINNQMEIISNLQNPQKNQPVVEQNGSRIDVVDIDCRKPINTHNSKSGVSLKCAYCSGDFRSRTELENHMKIQHNIGGKHKCLICDEILPSPAVLAEHKLTHCKVGAPGKCSHCMKSLSDANVFKQHLNEHNSGNGISKHKTSPYELPVECIVCRQVLSSEFEITLHAKFHTKSFDVNEEQRTCALCLESLPASNAKKICDLCIKKHNFSAPALLSTTNFSTNQLNKSAAAYLSSENKVISCNLCKNVLLNAQKLQEHLIEHTFRGTNGYICYICSSIFTSALGLQQHIQEHEKDSGSNIKPYECNLCSEKYFFRTELEHHQLDHEAKLETLVQHEGTPSQMIEPEVKIETKGNHENLSDMKEDDDEYIEVEKISS